MVDEHANRLYKPFHFLIVVLGSVNTQGPVADWQSLSGILKLLLASNLSNQVTRETAFPRRTNGLVEIEWIDPAGHVKPGSAFYGCPGYFWLYWNETGIAAKSSVFQSVTVMARSLESGTATAGRLRLIACPPL